MLLLVMSLIKEEIQIQREKIKKDVAEKRE
jgi:hypothetical protein